MAFSLRTLFRRGGEHDPPAPAPPEIGEELETPTVCPHTVLRAHWDDPADMGNDDAATSWTCEACGETFSPEVAAALRATEADRLKQQLGFSEQSTSETPSST